MKDAFGSAGFSGLTKRANTSPSARVAIFSGRSRLARPSAASGLKRTEAWAVH